jgi:hypothetical protein
MSCFKYNLQVCSLYGSITSEGSLYVLNGCETAADTHRFRLTEEYGSVAVEYSEEQNTLLVYRRVNFPVIL